MRGGEYLDAERLVGLWRSPTGSTRRRTRRERPPDRRFSGRARQPLAARRTRAFQPCREPQGRRAAVRFSGDLRRLARCSRRASTRAPQCGAARIRRRGGEERTAATAGAGRTRWRELCVAETNRRLRRDFSSASLDVERGDAAARRRREAGAGRRHRAHAGRVARGPAEPTVSRGDGRIERALPRGRLVAARLSGRGDPRRRAADTRGDRQARRLGGRTGNAARQMGRGRPDASQGDARPIRRDREPRPQGGRLVRESDAPAGGRRHRRTRAPRRHRMSRGSA